MFIRGVNQEEGEVVAVHGQKATVKIAANKACERCQLCEKVSSTEMLVDAFCKIPVRKGERVILSVRPGTIVKSATILYILPILGLVLGYYFARFLNTALKLGLKGELFPALLSIIFLFSFFVPIHIYDKKKQKDKRFRVYIIERL